MLAAPNTHQARADQPFNLRQLHIYLFQNGRQLFLLLLADGDRKLLNLAAAHKVHIDRLARPVTA